MDRKMVNFIKEQYPPGTRIRLNSMEDPYHPILPGTEGEVDFVDDEGQIFMKWDNGRTLPLAPGEDSFTVLPPKLTTLKLYMPLTADLYERNEYGEFDDSSTLLEGRELRGYQDQITAALVKNRMPEETERGLMHWYDEADSVDRKVTQEQRLAMECGSMHGLSQFYRDQFLKLVDKGYLVQRGSGNTYDFYETPQRETRLHNENTPVGLDFTAAVQKQTQAVQKEAPEDIEININNINIKNMGVEKQVLRPSCFVQK